MLILRHHRGCCEQRQSSSCSSACSSPQGTLGVGRLGQSGLVTNLIREDGTLHLGCCSRVRRAVHFDGKTVYDHHLPLFCGTGTQGQGWEVRVVVPSICCGLGHAL